ncbi:MAG: NusA-like transcription termination signal-binding factor [Candidatus Nanoarchaeia archaeon]|nr:NusA-like transcription termination signal-binding factor [Candidatus Nanoarchaeia archaeon]
MRYGIEEINYINIMEKSTKAKIKDCYLENDLLVFITDEGEIGKAIGKAGSNIKRVSNLLHKQIKVIEFNKSPEIFIENLIKPVKGKVYKDENGTIFIEVKDMAGKANLLGKNRRNLIKIQEIASKYFKDIQIKVV